MTVTEVLKSDVVAAFEIGGYTMNERFPECGFVYFPTDGSKSKESPNQGRVFWSVEKGEDDELDKACGICSDKLNISCSWGRPTDAQLLEIQRLLKLYVLYNREHRPK